jgi:amidase
MSIKRIHAFTNDVLADHDATGIAALINERKISAEEVAAAAIARARMVKEAIEPIAFEAFDSALADSRNPRSGIFSGVPTFIKDNANVTGMPARHGSAATSSNPVRKTDNFISQYLKLGFTVLGKSRLPEFGFNATTEFVGQNPCRNPWNTEYSSGGSSGGSAALVAAGVVPIAHGNDGGGSIRIPASCCGLVGLKTTKGRFNASDMARSLPLNIVVDGALTRSVRDAARFCYGMEQVRRNKKLPPVGEVTAPGKKRLRIGLVIDSITGVPTDPETRAAVESTVSVLETMGHRVEAMPVPVEASFIEDFTHYWSMLAFLVGTFGKFVFSWDFNSGKFEPFTLGLIRYYKKRLLRTPGTIYRLSRAASEYAEGIKGYDAVISPVLASTTVELGYLNPGTDFDTLFRKLIEYVSFTPLNNAAGSPAITLPLGMSSNGVPIGIQFQAGHGMERTLLELAFELEEARPWKKITG